jgi:hypothetical protein
VTVAGLAALIFGLVLVALVPAAGACLSVADVRRAIGGGR